MDTALVGVFGALVGIVLTALFSLLNENVKWKREQRVRFNLDRIQAYVDFLGAIRGVIECLQDLGIAENAGAPDKVLDEHVSKVDAAMKRGITSHHRVQILGSPSVVAVALELSGFVDIIFDAWQANGAHTDGLVDEQAYGDVEHRFYKVVRDEVHVR